MSELFDDDPRATPPDTRAPRRSRALVITAVVVVVAILALTGFASLYTDRLWFQHAGPSGDESRYGQVFSTLLITKIVLFLVFGAILGGAVALNIYLAYRFRPLFRPTSREQSNLDRYRDVVTPIRVWVVTGVALVFGAFAGTSGMSHWRTYLLWRNAVDFGSDDPYFKRDVGYYVFHLPWQHFVVDFAMATFVLAIIAALVTHYLYGGVRLQVTQDRLSGAAQVQLSVLLGLFVLAKGVDYYLDRFDLVTQDNKLFTGMNYAGENAVLPAKNILLAIALICAVLFFLNVWRRTWMLPSVGLALLVLSAILLGMIWPAIVQQFQVKPSEADKESSYIQQNITATRNAYDLTDITLDDNYRPEKNPDVTAGELQPLTSTVPLVDPKQVSPAFENLQQKFGYYSVPSILDVDHYKLDDTDRALVLGVRELDQSRLPSDSRNWSNLHTAYTHGDGIIAAYANQRDTANFSPVVQDGEDAEAAPIEWAQGINGDETDLSAALGDFETRVYYGEKSPDYSVVGKAKPESTDVERNLPVPGSDDTSTNTTFDGTGDASVGSTFNQLMFAIKFGEPNFLLSGRVNANSKVLFDREPQQRVEKVAPWLTVDSDAYPAVVDGRIVWILDGYTTTDRFPNAQRDSFDTMIDDALQVDTGLQTLPTDEINYMRNAVKATVDAYTGDVVLYQWDETDPLLQAWMKIFPDSVRPKSEMSEQLIEHVRYPEDIFKVQRYQYARYHVTDPGDWYENNDRWDVPIDPQAPSTFQAPYRLFVADDAAAEGASTFSLTSVYVPYQRDNLASFVSVDSDATTDNYGKIIVRRVSDSGDSSGDDATATSEQISGPGQVANEFANNDSINGALFKFKQNNAKVTYGNMLTFPIRDGLMYVQPVYVSRQLGDSSYPELRYVLVKYGDEVGYGTTFQTAIENLLRSSPGTTTPPTDPTNPTDPPSTGPTDPPSQGGGGTVQERIDRALDKSIAAFDKAQTALQSGDLGKYQKQVKIAQKWLEVVVGLRGLSGVPSSDAPSAGSTDTASDPASSESPTP